VNIIRLVLWLLLVLSLIVVGIIGLDSLPMSSAIASTNYRYAYLVMTKDDYKTVTLKFVDSAHPDKPAETRPYILPEGWSPPYRGYYVNPISPDGEWIAFVLPSTDQKRLSVQLYNLRSGEQNQIAEGYLNTPSTSVLWSPDSRYLALDIGQRTNDVELLVYALAEHKIVNLSDDDFDQRDSGWSPDAGRVATFTEPKSPCARNVSCHSDLAVFDVADDSLVNSIDLSATNLGGNQACSPNFSPDNRYVAFISNCYLDFGLEGLPSEVYLWDLLENDLKPITDFSSALAGKLFRITYKLSWLNSSSLLIGATSVVAGELGPHRLVTYRTVEDATSLWFSQGSAGFIQNLLNDQILLLLHSYSSSTADNPRNYEQIRIADIDHPALNSPSPGLKIPAGCRFDWSPDGKLLAYTTSPDGDCRKTMNGVNFIDFSSGSIQEHHLSEDDNGDVSYILPIGWAAS
jgi:hypothetical protein